MERVALSNKSAQKMNNRDSSMNKSMSESGLDTKSLSMTKFVNNHDNHAKKNKWQVDHYKSLNLIKGCYPQKIVNFDQQGARLVAEKIIRERYYQQKWQELKAKRNQATRMKLKQRHESNIQKQQYLLRDVAFKRKVRDPERSSIFNQATPEQDDFMLRESFYN